MHTPFKHWIAISVLMLSFRMIYTESFHFAFLVWNLMLAGIPYLLSKKLFLNIEWQEKKWIRNSICFLWLLFLPNSFYLLTDFVHLTYERNAPYWIDIILLSYFTVMGFYLGYYSLYLMENIVKIHYGFVPTKLFSIGVIFLSAYGIYLGRFVRLNSWDLFNKPVQVMNEIKNSFINPDTFYFSFGMGLFLTMLYLSIQPFINFQNKHFYVSKNL